MAKKLTESQQHNLDTIRNGGLDRRNFTFYRPGSNVPIRGLNNTTVRNLVKMGLVVVDEDGIYRAK